MMYVELIKNFFLADSRELMNVRAISASESKNVWLLLSTRRTSRPWKIFFRRFEQTDRRLSHFGLLSPKTSDSHFVDMMYVEFMKNFFSPIRAKWWVLEPFRTPEPKNVWFPLSRHDVRLLKIFFSLNRANWWTLESFRPPEPKNDWFPLSRHDVPRVHEKFFWPIRANWWVLESFRPPEPKNLWFPLSRHDVRRVQENFFSCRFERTDMC